MFLSKENILPVFSRTNILFPIVSVILAILFIVFSSSPLYVLGGILFLLLAVFANEEILILISVLLFLVITRGEFDYLRNVASAGSVVLLITVFIRRYYTKVFHLKKAPKPFVILISMIFGATFLSVVFNHFPGTSIYAFTRMSLFFLLLFIYYQLMPEKNGPILLVMSLLTAQFIISLTVVYDFARGGFTLVSAVGLLVRFSGFIDHPNTVGIFTIIAICFIIVLYFTDYARRYKPFIWILLFLNILVLILTDSRSAFLAFIIAVPFILYNVNRKLLIKITVTAVIIVIILSFLPFIQDMFELLGRVGEYSEREHYWNSGIEIFKRFPLFGVGPQRYPEYFFTYLSDFAKTQFTSVGGLDVGMTPNPHNFFLLMAAENGIGGIIFSFYIFILFFYLSIKNMIFNKLKNKNYYLISVGCTAAGMSVFLRAFLEALGILGYGYILLDLPFWIVFLVVVHIYSLSKKNMADESKTFESESI